jgi:hypothetical protein
VVAGDEEERIQERCDEETLIDCAAGIAERWTRKGGWYTEYRYTRRVLAHEVVANKPAKVEKQKGDREGVWWASMKGRDDKRKIKKGSWVRLSRCVKESNERQG